jgi:PGF-CTERM protein
LVVVSSFVIGLLAAGVTMPVAAHHEDPDDEVNQNTWLTYPQPSEFQEEGASRQPGYDEASHQTFSQPGIDVDHWRYMIVRSDEPGVEFDNCDTTDGRAIGIDRGSNQSGTNTDDASITDSFKRIEYREHTILLEIAGPNDVQDPVPLWYEDQVVGWLVECYKNPSEPGWYQFHGIHNGTREMADGSLEWREWQWRSHHFWICDCENKSEAIDKLGEPPSEEVQSSWRWGYENGQGQSADTAGEPPWHPDDAQQQPPEDYSMADEPTPTPNTTSTVTPTATGTATGTATAAETDVPDGTATATGTEAADGTATDPNAVENTATETAADGDADDSTPAAGDGAGFGGVFALVALASAALLVMRRTA